MCIFKAFYEDYQNAFQISCINMYYQSVHFLCDYLPRVLISIPVIAYHTVAQK